jgi:excinuclease ABC subunit C
MHRICVETAFLELMMDIELLKQKAAMLPMAPGVYLMMDKDGTVIYVGKAKKLRNRVSQYFHDTASHNAKTRLMVSKVHTFEVIVAASEFEALVLECSLIKRHMPKYNILLKDDKGYPYLRLDSREKFPRITLVGKLSDDGADYYGPFGSRGVTGQLLSAINTSLCLPNCSKQFPRDLGKGRVCLNYHMKQCSGWCQKKDPQQEYRLRMEQAKKLLQGDFRQVSEEIRRQMLEAADNMNFELAAGLRDRLNAVTSLGQKQYVTAGASTDTDVIGFAQTDTKACFTVLHFRDGDLLDKDYEIISAVDSEEAAVSALIKQYYLSRGMAPRLVLLPFAVEDSDLFAQLLEQEFGCKTKLKVPQKGDNHRLVEMAVENARQELERITTREEKYLSNVHQLGAMLAIEPPYRIESFDISNTSGADIVAAMVVFHNGKPLKGDYKRFQIKGLADQDDYASMAQVVRRRFTHYLQKDKGFDTMPDLLLIDGGAIHAATALVVLQELGLSVPVFGMVKDDRHRTRALVTPEGDTIGIDGNQAIFSFIGSIQEETHRFAITYHRGLRSKRLRYSELDKIPGVGPKRKRDLLKTFKSISAIQQADLSELERILPKDAASAVYQYFKNKEE